VRKVKHRIKFSFFLSFTSESSSKKSAPAKRAVPGAKTVTKSKAPEDLNEQELLEEFEEVNGPQMGYFFFD
jgi:hypothetical protein